MGCWWQVTKRILSPCALKNRTLHALELIFTSVGLRCKLCGRCSRASNADKLLILEIQNLLPFHYQNKKYLRQEQNKGGLQYLLFWFFRLLEECSEEYSYSYKNEEPNLKKKKKKEKRSFKILKHMDLWTKLQICRTLMLQELVTVT